MQAAAAALVAAANETATAAASPAGYANIKPGDWAPPAAASTHLVCYAQLAAPEAAMSRQHSR